MAVPRGKAAYKKKDGILTVSDDAKFVTWTPLPGTGPPVVSLAVVNITNLQQTPDSSPKVMLKIFEKAPNTGGDAVPFLFHFNSPTDARSEANAVKDLLSRLLAEVRSNDPALPKPTTPAANSGPPATAEAAAAPGPVAGGAAAASRPPAARYFDDNQLKFDIELQQSLMKKDRNLHQIYMDARATKPEAISDAAFNTQFWSTRTDLLRAHALEMNQKKGAWNVLSAIKVRTVENDQKIDMNVADIQMIFSQHPLVRRIYDENVPKKMSESAFWSGFFLSRLAKKLKGERVSDSDPAQPMFDRYDPAEDTVAFTSKILAQQVPHIIDIEGNEENQGGFKSGNRKDIEMRAHPNLPIVKVMNSISEKIMANVAPSDQDPTNAVGMDDPTYQELALRDLRGDAEGNRIKLNVKEQSRFFSNQSVASSALAKVYKKQVPSEVLFDVQSDIETLEEDGSGGIDLHVVIGIDDESESDDEEAPREPHVGSRTGRKAAQVQIVEALARTRMELHGHNPEAASPMGTPPDITQKAYLANATTTEFLKQFWNAFLSGDPDRAQELASHVESLKKSMTRIEAIAQEADEARERIIEQKKQEIIAHFKKTGNKIRWKPDLVEGGQRAVLTLLRPTIDSLKAAQDLYRAALAAEGITPSTENE